MNTVTKKTIAFKPSGNRYLQYAIKQLMDSDCKLTDDGYSQLRNVMSVRIGFIRNNRKYDTRRTLRKKDRRASIRYTSDNSFHENYLNSINILVRAIIKNANNNYVTKDSVIMALRDICPLWPFCK